MLVGLIVIVFQGGWVNRLWMLAFLAFIAVLVWWGYRYLRQKGYRGREASEIGRRLALAMGVVAGCPDGALWRD